MIYFLVFTFLLFFSPHLGSLRRGEPAPYVPRVCIKMSACLLAGSCLLIHPTWLTIAIQHKHEIPQAAPISWRTLEQGLDTAIIEVALHQHIVDRIHLVRVDPAYFSFRVHQSAHNPRTAESWRQQLQAQVVINGSYYDHQEKPLTPIKSQGVSFGPSSYTSTHGAFVSSKHYTGIIDLQGIDVHQAIVPYPDVLVSYPLLFDTLGTVRAAGHDDWLANRSFLAIDTDGMIVLGMTEQGFFSLKRLAHFLNQSPLKLLCALNLDGGPISSLAVKTDSYHHVLSGRWALQNPERPDQILHQRLSSQASKLPIVLAVYRKERIPGEHA